MKNSVQFYNHRTDPAVAFNSCDITMLLFLLSSRLLEWLGFTDLAMADDDFFEDVLDLVVSMERCFFEKTCTGIFLPERGENIAAYFTRTMYDFCREFMILRNPGNHLKDSGRRNGLQVTRAIYEY